MKLCRCVGGFAFFAALTLVGCQQPASPDKNVKEKEVDAKAEIAAALAKLSPDDRKLAEAQVMCPIGDLPLGSMGKPAKIMVKDQPVFLCCASCEKEALDNPEKTLAKVADLKKR